MNYSSSVPVLLILALGAGISTAGAAPPDAGTIMREIGDKPATLPERLPERPVKPLLPPSPVQAGPKVTVKEFRFIGNTLFTQSELGALLSGYVGKELSFDELARAAARISEFYSSKGYIAQALLPPQEIANGVVLIQIIEGKLGSIRLDPASSSRFKAETMKKYIFANNPAGETIRIDKLERSLLLLNDIPGVVAASNIQPGARAGESDLLVKLSDSPLVYGNLDFDNHGNPSSGEYRLTATVNVNNPGGFGDQISVKGLSSIDTNYGRIGYNFPVGHNGLRAGVSLSYLHYELGGDLDALNARGNAFTTGVYLNQPIIRGRSGNLYGNLSYDYRKYDNRATGAETSNKSLHSGSYGLFGDRYDTWLGGGYTNIGATVTIGNADLSGNAIDLALDQAGPRVDGVYQKTSYSISRLQNLYQNRTTLWLGLNGQFSAGNLDSSEKMNLGGPNAVRALPPSEGSGDNGLILTAELRQNIGESFQMFGFYDFGWIQQYSDTWTGWNTSGNPNSYDVDGVGLGVTWIKPGIASIKLTMAQRLGSNPGMNAQGRDSDGTKREPRFLLQGSYYF